VRAHRRPLGTLLALSIAVPALVVIPTLSRPAVTPHPVKAHLTTMTLAGVDPSAARLETPPRVARALAHTSASTSTSTSTSTRRTAAGPAVLTAPTSTSSFATIGVTWTPTVRPTHLLVSVRTLTGGTWSTWEVLGGQSEDVPDTADLPPGARVGTAPLYVGPSDGVQVRVDRISGPLPSDLRVDLIDPGTSPADGALQPSLPASSAMAAGARPPIITRAQWGADESIRLPTYDDPTVKAAFIHHTASTTNYTRGEAAAMIRGIYSYAVLSEGYADVPYNFLVDKFGRIYEGRRGSMTSAVHGGATGGFNTDTMSVSALGNFETSAAPTVMVDAIARLLAWRLATFYRDPHGHTELTAADGGTRYPIGQVVRFDTINGHRDADLTACPGANLYPQLPQIRDLVAKYMGANLVNPGVTAPAARLSSAPRRTAFTVHSRVLKAQQWQLTVTPACGTAPVRTVTGTATRKQPISVTWHGQDDNGATVPPGAYLLELDSWSGRSRSVSWVHQVVVGAASPGVAGTRVPRSSRPGWYHAVTPRTVFNSLSSRGGATPFVLARGGLVDVPVLGRAGVPADGVNAVVLSVRTSCAAGSARLAASGSSVSTAADVLRLPAHTEGSGLVVVRPGADGQVLLHNAGGATRVVVDVVGYFSTDPGSGPAAGAGYIPVRRVTVAGAGSPLLLEKRVPISLATSDSPVPTGAVAALLQVRTAPTSQASNLWVWPSGAARPAAPQIVTTPTQDGTHRIFVPLGAADSVDLAADAPGAVSVTVLGYQVVGGGSAWHTDGPQRLLDNQAMGSNSERTLRIGGVPALAVPAGARYAVLQVGASVRRGPTALRLAALGKRLPRVPDLVTSTGTSGVSLVVVGLGAKGSVVLHNGLSPASVTVDLVGWLP
jgi:hypothetical protein